MIHSVPKNKIEQVIVKYADIIFRIAYQNLISLIVFVYKFLRILKSSFG